MTTKDELMGLLREALPTLLREEYGIDLAAVPDTLGRIESLTQAQTEKMWKDTIGLEGQEYDTAVKGIQEYFNKLPEATQQALDNPEGLKYIWSQVQPSLAQSQEQAAQLAPVIDEMTGEVSQPSINSFSANKTWTEAEIDALVNSGRLEDPAIEQMITQAYAEGRVK